MRYLLVLTLMLATANAPRLATHLSPQKPTVQAPVFTTPKKYDPKRDPAADLGLALAEATRSHRLVLLDVGGEWCVWCHIMDEFFADHAELLALRERNFVMLKVNMSPENQNLAFLFRYPEIPGYPHLFVLDAGGRLIKSQSTSDLQEGNSYSLGQFKKFLERYQPASR